MPRETKAVNPGSPRKVAIYARVSTAGQDTDNQTDELRALAERAGWEVVKEYVDHGISGSKGRDSRPALDAMMLAATRREFDMVACWSVDRLGRSLQHLVCFLDEVHGLGLDLYIHQQGLDTTTPGGKALFQMCGVFAEFERSMIQERVKSGLARARASGKRLGRPKKATPQVRRKVMAGRKAGKSMRAIAAEMGISSSLVHAMLHEKEQAS